MDGFFAFLDAVNTVMLGVPTLVGLLSVGVLFTIWSRFGQYRSLTHGVSLLRGGGLSRPAWRGGRRPGRGAR